MKIAMQLTLDGMVRALRMRAHEIGDADDLAEQRAAERNETALTLLAQEARRYALEAGDEFGR